MAITPELAAEFNDERIATFIVDEELRINEALRKDHFTDGPPVDVEPSTFEIEGVDRKIMKRYNDTGWRIEVVTKGEKQYWRFTRNTK